MSTTTTTAMLPVAGATLYTESRGSGPVLLLICGGVYDAAAFAGLANALADRFTVLTYDRRGNSRSPLDGPPEPQRIPVHADDAYRVLVAAGVTAERPAAVFGNSSGAEIALELSVRHPELVRVVVAHEPPMFDLLPDHQYFTDLMRTVEETFAAQGPYPAMGVFQAGLTMRGGDDPDRVPGGGDAPPAADAASAEPDPQTAEMMARMGRNMEFFIGYEVPPFGRYAVDVAALAAAPVRVVSAVGELSEGEPPNRVGVVLAERLGLAPTVFPGDHGGFGSDTEGFAATLAEVLAG